MGARPHCDIAEHEAAKHLLSFFPDISLTLPDYLARRNALQDELWPSVPFLPGAEKLIRHLHAHGIPIAVATGSRRRNYELKTGRLRDVFDLFEGRVICGDDDVEGRDGKRKLVGKPDPDIFLAAARQELQRPVGYGYYSECSQSQLADRAKGLVFEDAIPGMQAGKRAGMNGVFVCLSLDPNPTDHRVFARGSRMGPRRESPRRGIYGLGARRRGPSFARGIQTRGLGATSLHRGVLTHADSSSYTV